MYIFFSILYLNVADFFATHLNLNHLGLQLFLIIIAIIAAIITSELLITDRGNN